MEKVFVYGSLKRGGFNYYNYQLGSSTSKFLGVGSTKEKNYTLLAIRRTYPALVEGGNQKIKGEIWNLDNSTYSCVKRMELMSGYKLDEIETSKGLCKVFLAKEYLQIRGEILKLDYWPIQYRDKWLNSLPIGFKSEYVAEMYHYPASETRKFLK